MVLDCGEWVTAGRRAMPLVTFQQRLERSVERVTVASAF